MKIVIDVSSIIYETGVSWYTRNLVRSLLGIDSTNDYVLFGGSLRRKKELKLFADSVEAKNVKNKFIQLPPSALSYLWNNLHKIDVETFTGDIDVFHSSDWTQPPTKAYKVTTIHDLAPLRFPEISHPKIVETHKKRLEWVKKEVDRVIAVSEFTKLEIIELLGIDEKKIVVIGEAADNLTKPSLVSINKTKKLYGIKKYLLVIGTDPRKNVPNIIRAFEKIRNSNEELQLVVVGRIWDSLPKTEGLFELGHVSSDNLLNLYSGAEALVYCSSYEGFGLPILEAMQLGCPVITSNISSMPEVAGNAAELVDPTNVDSIVNGIKKVLANKKVYVEKGIKQAKKFSWKNTAELTLKVYKGEL